MRVLLDEDLAHKLRHTLTDHDFSTVRFLRWDGLKKGQLIRRARSEGFEVFVTGDRILRYRQNAARRHIALVVLTAHNRPIVRNHLPAIAAAVDSAVAGSFQVVECGDFRR